MSVTPKVCRRGLSVVKAELVFEAAESYEKRGFAELLPLNWTGTVDTLGASDASAVAEGSTLEPIDPESTEAFAAYLNMMANVRAAELAAQAQQPQSDGRATCGPEEGREFVSNTRPILKEGVKCVEYWGPTTYVAPETM